MCRLDSTGLGYYKMEFCKYVNKHFLQSVEFINHPSCTAIHFQERPCNTVLQILRATHGEVQPVTGCTSLIHVLPNSRRKGSFLALLSPLYPASTNYRICISGGLEIPTVTRRANGRIQARNFTAETTRPTSLNSRHGSVSRTCPDRKHKCTNNRL